MMILSGKHKTKDNSVKFNFLTQSPDLALSEDRLKCSLDEVIFSRFLIEIKKSTFLSIILGIIVDVLT